MKTENDINAAAIELARRMSAVAADFADENPDAPAVAELKALAISLGASLAATIRISCSTREEVNAILKWTDIETAKIVLFAKREAESKFDGKKGGRDE